MKNTADHILTDLKANGVMHVILNRPDKLNALNQDVLSDLLAIFQNAKQDSNVNALLITGAGKAFCAGADISQFNELKANNGVAFAKKGQQVFRTLETMGKPSLVAVNGYAFGGGCELAMAATMRIASDNAQFGQPEVKLGLIPGYGGTQRLARLVGKGRALDLCISGRFIKADTALQWGLVSEVTTSDELLARAEAILDVILQMAPLAVRSAMKVIDDGYDMPLEQALQLEADEFGMLCATQDKAEGVKAFLEKRPANFQGK